ncbi:MAG TPA: hypothetical protein VGD10_08010 [Allosphingosinicella sp.]|uniref:hypothetical protein n=1 Tax=Allosphingosinicella sp. TaxID=2823234 RepID=UPI002EDA79E9
MALSRMAVLAAVILLSTPAGAAPVTAEEALQMHRQTLQPVAAVNGCPKGADGEEIVVCGRREESPYRMPLPVTREAGVPVELPGEAPRASTSVGGCLRLCHKPVGVTVGTKF